MHKKLCARKEGRRNQTNEKSKKHSPHTWRELFITLAETFIWRKLHRYSNWKFIVSYGEVLYNRIVRFWGLWSTLMANEKPDPDCLMFFWRLIPYILIYWSKIDRRLSILFCCCFSISSNIGILHEEWLLQRSI